MKQSFDFRERFRIRKLIYSKPTIIILAALTLLVAHGAWGMYVKSEEAIAKRDKAALELDQEKQRQQELNDDIARLSTERGKEAEIRDRFMVAKPGEKVIVITSPNAEKTHTVTVPTPEAEPTLMDQFKAAVGISEE